MKNVVFGLLGSVLDSGKDAGRWERWRPSVALCQQENFIVHRFELIYELKFIKLAKLICEDIKSVSPETEVILHNMNFNNPWDFEEVYGALHDFCRARHFDTDKEEYFVHITTGTHVEQICLFLLTESHYFPAKLIQTSPPKREDRNLPGAFAVIDLDLSRYDRIAMRFKQEAKDDISFLKSGIDTRNKRFNSLIAMIEKVASSSRAPILLMGPTGSGKSLLARKIYELKKMKNLVSREFIEVNCATIRGDNAMSALFGHKKGSFTGAMRDREGLLCSADGGVLFLDEAGELGLDEQSMLLRAIEEKRFLPFGSDTEVKSEFQLICGTNRDLSEEVSRRNFRNDLFARINLWTFRMPGLQDRPEDIEPNMNYELDKYADKTGVRITFNKEARKRFLEFAVSAEASWKANFRDLNGAIVRMATLASNGRITVEVVEDEIQRLRESWFEKDTDSGTSLLHEMLAPADVEKLDLFDAIQLEGVIEICRQSRTLSEAGRKLFAGSRQNKKTPNDADRLRKYLSRFNLNWNDMEQNRLQQS